MPPRGPTSMTVVTGRGELVAPPATGAVEVAPYSNACPSVPFISTPKRVNRARAAASATPGGRRPLARAASPVASLRLPPGSRGVNAVPADRRPDSREPFDTESAPYATIHELYVSDDLQNEPKVRTPVPPTREHAHASERRTLAIRNRTAWGDYVRSHHVRP